MTTAILISIKPVFSERIFDLSKAWEFRKRLPAGPVARAVVYASSPVKRIVGEFEVTGTISMHPALMWGMTANAAGIDRAGFDAYFGLRNKSHALEIGKVTRYETPIDPRAVDMLWTAPQSYSWLSPTSKIGRAVDQRVDPWLLEAELAEDLDVTIPELRARLHHLVPVDPAYIRARMVAGRRLTMYSPAARALLRE